MGSGNVATWPMPGTVARKMEASLEARVAGAGHEGHGRERVGGREGRERRKDGLQWGIPRRSACA